MTRQTSTQVWFQGGPAYGAIRSVNCGMEERPPELLIFSGGDVFVGASHMPAPAARPACELEAAPADDAGFWAYRYVDTLTL